MTQTKSVILEIPNIEQMSDDALASLAVRNDGRWSAQTKALLEQFKTTKLDLNLPWARTWVGWRCPCCNRDKPALARLSRGGVLRCKLEWHHDHLEDYVRRFFDDMSPPVPNDGSYNLQRNVAKDAISTLSIRFRSVLICADCNSSESEAKRNVDGVDRDFTFSPKEIAEFIKPNPNSTHEIDITLAQQIWEAKKSDFEDRRNFARKMAQRFANEKNRQEIVSSGPDLYFRDSTYFWAKIQNADPSIIECTLASQIEKRSVAKDGDSAFSIRRSKQTPPPTDTEFNLIERRLPAGKEYWIGLGERWICECCGRNKREICRRSNRGEWTARIHKIRDWEEEKNPINLEWRRRTAQSILTIGAHRTAYICQDCRNIITKLQRLHPGTPDGALTPSDLSNVLITIDTNSDHEVDYEKAFQLASANQELVLATEDYNRHWALSQEAKSRFKRLTTFAKNSADQALKIIAEDLVKDGLAPAQDSIVYAQWLVDEGRRFEGILNMEKAFIVKAVPVDVRPREL